MILIDDILISDDVLKKQFLCNLKACKGACCVEGDLGAPLNADELPVLTEIYAQVKPFLTQQGIDEIETQGLYILNDDGTAATPLIDGKACVYINYDADGTAKCGIEQAFLAGKIDWKKPISCHLYPIRLDKTKYYTAVNYDKWDICNAACELGKKNQLPVYKFLKEPLIRQFGADFYEQLQHAAEQQDWKTALI